MQDREGKKHGFTTKREIKNRERRRCSHRFVVEKKKLKMKRIRMREAAMCRAEEKKKKQTLRELRPI